MIHTSSVRRVVAVASEQCARAAQRVEHTGPDPDDPEHVERCTEGARERKTWRFTAIRDGCKPAWLPKNGINRPPPHFNGKEGVSGSSPEEGSVKAPAQRGFCVQVGLLAVERAVGA